MLRQELIRPEANKFILAKLNNVMSKMNKSLVIGSITWYHLSLTRGAPEINV